MNLRVLTIPKTLRQQCDFTISDFLQAGMADDLKKAGFTVDELKRAGLTAAQLRRMGFRLPI